MTSSQILTAAQMRDAEQRLFDAGMSEFDLMKVAAGGAAEWVRRLAAGRAVTVLCGPGNNGGDGYVIAHRLREAGNAVAVIAPVEPKTQTATEALAHWGGPVATSGREAEGGVFLDCLFGSGLSRPLSGEHALLLRDLASRHDFSIAVDVPSGIESDTGNLLNEKLPRFDVTLALGAWKFAHRLLPGRGHMGTLRLIPIGIDTIGSAAEVICRPRIHAPEPDSHKYRRGFATIVGGDMPGAALLAARAAMRAGAGYVKLSTHDVPHAPADLIVDTSHVRVALADERIKAVLIGPGLGRHEGAKKGLEEARKCKCGKVFDADALHIMDGFWHEPDERVLATPHDGELEVLCRKYSVIADGRLNRAKALASASGMVICAKGPDTIVAAPDGRIAIATPAPSWLSIAGTGDVLAGIAVSRLATGLEPFEAACEAVWLHGEAARICDEAFTASELAGAVSQAMVRCL